MMAIMRLPECAEWRGVPSPRQAAHSDAECVLCGRPIIEAKSVAVWLVGGGTWLATADEPLDDDPGQMGRHYVGSGCAKKIPKAFHLDNQGGE